MGAGGLRGGLVVLELGGSGDHQAPEKEGDDRCGERGRCEIRDAAAKARGPGRSAVVLVGEGVTLAALEQVAVDGVGG